MSDFVDFATYSTSEQVVDTWIDGKTLYRRVITGTITALDNIRSSTDILTSVDSIVNGNGTVTLHTGSEYVRSNSPFYVTIEYTKK